MAKSSTALKPLLELWRAKAADLQRKVKSSQREVNTLQSILGKEQKTNNKLREELRLLRADFNESKYRHRETKKMVARRDTLIDTLQKSRLKMQEKCVDLENRLETTEELKVGLVEFSKPTFEDAEYWKSLYFAELKRK